MLSQNSLKKTFLVAIVMSLNLYLLHFKSNLIKCCHNNERGVSQQNSQNSSLSRLFLKNFIIHYDKITIIHVIT